MSDPAVPSWLSAPCPSWCVQQHAENDLPADRAHQSASQTVPVALLRGIGEPTSPAGPQAPAVDLAVVLHRSVNETETWLYVGDGRHQGLELSAGSWGRVVSVVRSVLGRA